MPRASGVFTLVPSYKATSGQNIKTEQHNPVFEDVAQGLTESLPRDGSAAMTGDLPMNGRKITNLKAGTDASDAVRKDQVTAYSAYLSAVAGLTFAANKLVYATGAVTAAVTDLTVFGRSLIGAADAAAVRTLLALKAGALAEKASTSDATTGTDDAKYMTAKATKASVDANIPDVLGDGQTWQDVTVSRAKNVSYQNATGRAVMVSVFGLQQSFEVSANGSTWVPLQSTSAGWAQVTAVVPAGHYYRAPAWNVLSYWAELR